MMMMQFKVFLAACCILQLCAAESKGPIAKTEYGAVRGTRRYATDSSRPVYSYFGVQYGRSPDYVFRFRPAEDPWKWDGVRDASDEARPLCVQDRDRYEGLRKNTFLKYMMPEKPTMSEHCLFLDIFTPKPPNDTECKEELLPVIFWIHGGSFDAFCSSTKLWALPAFEDVVLVQVQYRLGLFGFLTTEDEWAPANIAFYDHLKALRWVQKNIRAFGGDPDSVTLMGQSAGAVGATAHTLIQENKGLFHKVIAISGAPETMQWKSTYRDGFQTLAKEANCDFGHNAASSTCLRNKVTTSRLMSLTKESNIHFNLLDDRTLFSAPVRKMIAEKSFSSGVPLLIGVTNGEQDYLLPRKVLPNVYNKGGALTQDDIEDSLQYILGIFYPEEKVPQIREVVVREYINKGNTSGDGMVKFRRLLEAIADCWFMSAATRFADKVKESGQKVYFYEFTAKPSMYGARPDEFVRPYNFSTADHGDDLLYILGFPFIPELVDGENPTLHFTKEEKDLSRKYMRVIAHFAKTGSPPDDIDWPQYPEYIEIGLTFKAQRKPFLKERVHFWNSVVYNLAFGNL